MKRMLALVACMMLVLSWNGPSFAADAQYPTRPINIITPYVAGGAFVMTTRALADAMTKDLGQNVIVTPTPGAGTALGIKKALSSTPDGYTLLMTALTSFSIRAQVRDMHIALEDAVPIGNIAVSVTYFATSKNNKKFSTLKEMVTYAKTNPEQVSVAILGFGGYHHVLISMLQKEAGIKLKLVPFDSGPSAIAAVLGGHVDMMVEDVYNPELHTLAITNKQRCPKYPDTPTFTELGYPNMAIDMNIGMFAPKGTPEPILKKLEEAVLKACKDPAYVKFVESINMFSLPMNSKDMASTLQTETRVTKELLNAGIIERQK
ncbi:MAG: tripartite tricarboxylate transporter substrate binding protein [Desulfobacteraceae bacterium]|nr:tripartite tricarboxylate transporter substrate binding protein [Desulfobacteraceae bacterium]